MAEISQFNIGKNHELFVLGDRNQAKEILTGLSSLHFLNPIDTVDVLKPREAFHFVVALCKFSERRKVKVVARSLPLITNPNCCKILYVDDPVQLKFEHFLFAEELNIKFTAYGISRDQRLRDFLKRTVLARRMTSPLGDLEEELEKAHHGGNEAEIRRLVARLLTMGKDNPDILRLCALGSTYTHQFKKSIFYLRSMLEMNPQDIWAATEMGKIFLRTNQVKEGIKAIEEMSDFIYTKDDEDNPETPPLDVLGCLGHSTFSNDANAFLSLRATLAMNNMQNDEAAYFYRLALRGGKKEPLVQAELNFNLGQILIKLGREEEAIVCFTKSLELGQKQFTKAQHSLQHAKNLLSKKRSTAEIPQNTTPLPLTPVTPAAIPDDSLDELEIE